MSGQRRKCRPLPPQKSADFRQLRLQLRNLPGLMPKRIDLRRLLLDRLDKDGGELVVGKGFEAVGVGVDQFGEDRLDLLCNEADLAGGGDVFR